ncbi:MAG: hypothetical protein QXG56_04180, partial [Candidatus Bathyarchaeia archaeon]
MCALRWWFNIASLAILGGKPTVTLSAKEKWKRPIEEEEKLIWELLEKGDISGSGGGLPLEFEEEFKKFVGWKGVGDCPRIVDCPLERT